MRKMRRLPVDVDLFDRMFHVPGSDELALLHVDRTSGAAGGDQQISLAAEKGRNLQDIDGFSRDFAVAGLVNVGENGESGRLGEAEEDFGAFDQAGAAESCGPKSGSPCRTRL